MPKQSRSNGFTMPSKVDITGRTSTITNSFVQAIIPQVVPTDEEIDIALETLGMVNGNIVCSYCGGESTQWDHLNAIVRKKQPTGYITEIANLVPACGTCNQSKGAKNWKEWMFGNAAKSPSGRGIPNIQERAEKLVEFERVFSPEKIDFESIVSSALWEEYWDEHIKVLASMDQAQKKADEVWNAVQDYSAAQ